MPVYNMLTNKWVMDYDYQKFPYYDPSDDSSEDEIDYGSDTESEIDEEFIPADRKLLLQDMLKDLSKDISEDENKKTEKVISTPIERSQNLRKEILKILKRK